MKTIFCDISGTLLDNPLKKAPIIIIAFLNAAKKAGHKVSIVTSTPILEMALEDYFAGDIDDILPVKAKSNVSRCDILIDDKPEIPCREHVDPQSDGLTNTLSDLATNDLGFTFQTPKLA